MFNFLFGLIVIAFLGMLFLNIFFRVKVFKQYKYLVQNKVQFNSKHFFNSKKMEEEVLSKYPQHKEEILKFVKMIEQSVQLASVLIFIIILLGYLLFRYQ